jgi:GDP-4-dehydro-6-deoxy-D-mannose reductase
MRSLVTGATGFIGRHLIDHLLAEGHEVWGTTFVAEELRLLRPPGMGARMLPMDIRDRHQVESVVEKVRPEAVFHLAAQAYPILSWKDPANTYTTNVLGTIYLYEALRKAPPRGGIVVASSGAAYGEQTQIPIPEDVPLRPMNPYGVSKAACDMISYQYARNYGMRILRARLFGTTGPGKQGDASGDFSLQLARAEKEGAERVIRVGTLDTLRDISDVRDVVRACTLLLERGNPAQPVNVGAGRAYSIREVLEILLKACRVPVRVETDPTLLRPVDEPVLVGDIRHLRSLGFVSRYPIEATLLDSLQYWRENVPLSRIGGEGETTTARAPVG